MRSRGKSIRRKIVGLLLLPLVSLIAVWGGATVITSREAVRLLEVDSVLEKVAYPTEDLVQGIQNERRQSLVYLADPRSSGAEARLRRLEKETDDRAEELRTNIASDADLDTALTGTDDELRTVLDGLDGLDSLRRKVEEGTITRSAALTAYNQLVDPCYTLLGGLGETVIDDRRIDDQSRALVGITRAREALSREDAIFSSAAVAGEMSRQDLRSFADRIAERRLQYDNNLPFLPAGDRAVYEKYWTGPDTASLREAEDRAIAAGPSGAVDAVNAERWRSAVDSTLEELDTMGAATAERYEKRVEPIAREVLSVAVLTVVVGAIAVLVSLIVSVRTGRGLVRDLSRLRKDAHEASGVRLPAVLRRLAAGEQVDVETEAPRLEYGPDEMGQVGQAVNTLQRAAVEAAVKQADMRRGVSEVFVNLARRSQVLLHRQLTLLDTMERRTDDTDELADLFKLDHLTTRMRRHAEGLVILSGAAPSRQWRKPVQLMDVVRAAVAEVEDYERIEVRRLPRLAVNGPAVADLTHLIAELLENATVFSPPHTAVQVIGERVANGFTLDIHDRGLGMAPDALLDANLRLAETPEFELSDTDRLGLFVVSRLARRQGVRVSLQPSPYGGTTAVVFIPATLLSESAGGGSENGDRTGQHELPGDRLASLSQAPLPLAGRPSGPASLLDGPVELEAPLGALDVDDDDDGMIFRSRTGSGRPGPRGGPGPVQTGEQHQQARDDASDGLEPTRSGGGLTPLPRRRSPVLVSDHGRSVEPADRRAPDGPSEAEERSDPLEKTTTTEPGGGLPRRVRQASLAPQLKAEPAQWAEREKETADPEPERDADEVRSRMASLQRGWQRGRADTGEDTQDSTTRDAGDTAPGTTSEGDGR